MDTPPSDSPDEQANSGPAAEVLKPRVDTGNAIKITPPTTAPIATLKKRRTYRPSHRATFIALAAIIVIVAVNAVVLTFVLKNKAKQDSQASGQVTLSSDVLTKIGVNKTTIGSSGAQLTIDPDAKFNGKVTTAGDINVGGQLKLTGKLNTNDASITRLEGGNTSLQQLDVNGKGVITDILARSTLTSNGATLLQGTVTIAKLLTVNDSVNVLGNVSIGGTLTVSTFTARSLASTSTLSIGGHVITSGNAPNVGPGGALGSNGTVGISGNDAAGNISINIGVSAVGGMLANVAFKTQYASLPRVVITPVGVGGSFYIKDLSVGGFSVYVTSGLPAGGYSINYIVEE